MIALPPGQLLAEAVYGCFYLGAVPAFLDPTTDPVTLSRCLDELDPAAILADHPIPGGRHVVTSVEFQSFSDVAVDGGTPWEGYIAESTVMLMYTSGTTGLPKGAEWTWDNIASQLELYQERSAASEFILFPLFSLNAIATGCRAIFPNFPTFAPRSIDLSDLITQVDAHRAEFLFASPALWRRYLDHIAAGGEGFTRPPITIATAGAAIGRNLVSALKTEFNDSSIEIPYAATEGLMPLTKITATAFLEQTTAWPIAQHGVPLGSPCHDVNVAIIDPGRIFGAEPATAADFLPEDMVGEIVISGRRTSPAYFGRADSNSYAKFHDTKGTLWHRMGDIGHIHDGALWLRCRKKDLATLPHGGALYPDQIEQRINDGIGSQVCAAIVADGRLTIVLPSTDPITSCGESELAVAIAQLGVEARVIILNGTLPVDSRHNSKIDRTALGQVLARPLESA